MRPRKSAFFKWVLASLLTVVFLPAGLAAQEYTPFEFGVNASILHRNRVLGVNDAGMGARFTNNLTSSIGLDSEFDSYFTNLAEQTTQDGGRATVFVAGIKAGIRRRKYGVFFKARPGVMNFGDVPTSSAIISGGTATTRKTHAALDLGVTGEFYLSPRTLLRIDIGQMLARYGDSTNQTFANGGSDRNVGTITGLFHLEIGAGYRLGRLETGEEASSKPGNFAAGVQYSLFTSERGLDTVRDESGIGGWFTWNFSKYFSLDSSTTYFPRLIHIADFQQGGRTFQAVAGLRGGIQRERVGVFGKLRPGIERYTSTVGDAITFADSPFTDFALDAGGIVEVYTSRKTMLRFDAGNTRIYYRQREVSIPSGVFHAASFTNNTIQLTAGFGWRF